MDSTQTRPTLPFLKFHVKVLDEINVEVINVKFLLTTIDTSVLAVFAK